MRYYNIAVPKTATESLQMSMKEASLDTFVTMKDEPYLDYVTAASHHIITGHFHFGVHGLIAPREDYKYFSAVREPLERLISDYRHHSEGAAKLMTLDEWVKSAPSNLMSIQMFGFGINSFIEIQEMMKQHYSVIGCSEHLREYFDELEKLFSVKLEMKRENVSTFEILDGLSDRTVQEFRDKNLLDYELYDLVKSGKVLIF
jgi:hypothetical protein